MVPITSPETEKLACLLKGYSLLKTVAGAAGLLTVPKLHANTLRVELLIHLVLIHCNGKKVATHRNFKRWLNDHLGCSAISTMEDPPEDLFTLNIETSQGNRRIFEGIWESSDYFLQATLDTLAHESAPASCKSLLSNALALLRLSEAVCERLGITRYYSEDTMAKGKVIVAPVTRVQERASAVTFTESDLSDLGVDKELLKPFILSEENRHRIKYEDIGSSSLENFPLVEINDVVILALPTAVSPAVRYFILAKLEEMGHLIGFERMLGVHQCRQIEEKVLWEIKDNTTSLKPPAPDKGPIPSLNAWLLKYDTNKFLHIVLLYDRLDLLAKEGLASMLQYPMPVQNGLESYIAKVAEHCKAAPEFSGGMTVFVLGGLGRGFALGYRSWPEKWHFSALRVPDILMLGLNPDRPFERYLKFIQQRDWAKAQGVDFFSFDGDFNHYCYWLDTSCQLIPREIQVQKGSVISLGCDCVFPVRKELRELADLHVAQTATGDFVKVTRYGRESFYASIRERPIYVSLDHLNKGVLAAVVEGRGLYAWLVILCEDNKAIRSIAYELWSGLLGLFDRLISELELPEIDLNKRAVEICLVFSGVSVPEGVPHNRSQISIDSPVLEKASSNHITIVLPEKLLYLFNQPANEGELYLLNTMARGLLSLMLGCDVSQVGNRTVEKAIHKVVDGDGARILHLFSSNNQIDYLLSQKSAAPVFLAHEDFVFSKLRLSNECVPANAKHLTTSEACIPFLEKVVDKIWTDIKRELSELNSGSVIVEMFSIHEAILKDKEHWRRTAKALIALYKNDNEGVAVANEREADRIHTSLPVRALIEMALCECPVNEGKALTNETRDTLIAKGALLMEVATESDAIYHRLAKPDIKVHPNGEYSLQKDYQQTIINPFLTNFKEEEFRSAADRYSELYEPDGTAEKRSSEDIYSEEYLSAFNAEFGLSVEDFVEAVAELFDIAIETDSVVVQSSFGDVSHRLQNERGLSFEAIEAFFKSFALWPRRHWDKAPHGFIGNDIWPWKFNRRLSLTYRPITVFGSQDQDIVVYGVGILKQGYVNLLDRISQAQLPLEFFQSREMRQYLGSVINQKGHDFAKSVAEEFRQHGWQACNEVQMSEMGAPPEDADGDIDVLAWKESEILLIECKRLQLARTVAEVGKVCERFSGEAKDELAKHIRRVNWLKNNPRALSNRLSFEPQVEKIDSRLITNTHVPMMYLSDLPYSAAKIGPLGWVGDQPLSCRP